MAQHARVQINTEALVDTLRDIDDGPGITFIPNSGNAGDSLIAEATYEFFGRICLPFEVGSLEDIVPKGSKVVIGGGGNIINHYTNVSTFIERNLDNIARLVILAHTVRDHQKLLGRLDDRFTIICRDRPSYDHCTAHAPKANVFLGDDLALLWDPNETRARAKRFLLQNFCDIKFLIRNIKHLLRFFYHAITMQDSTIISLRTDRESTGIDRPQNNVDLSQVFSTDNMTEEYSACAVYALCALLDRATKVITDRLHIAIMSAILGKTVYMYDNNYGKNRDVYEQSLANRFTNITFVDERGE